MNAQIAEAIGIGVLGGMLSFIFSFFPSLGTPYDEARMSMGFRIAVCTFSGLTWAVLWYFRTYALSN